VGNSNHTHELIVEPKDECVRKAAQRNSMVKEIKLLAQGGQLDQHSGDT
jgi:hypothetical protein